MELDRNFFDRVSGWEYMGISEAVQTQQGIPNPTTTCRSCSLFHNARPALFGRLATGVDETVLHGSWSLQLLIANPGRKWLGASKVFKREYWMKQHRQRENHPPICDVIFACADLSDPQNAQSTNCLSLLTPLRRSGPSGEVDPQSS